MLKIISTKRLHELEANALLCERSLCELKKKYDFINQENRSLHKEKEKFNILESDAVKSEQLKYADLFLKLEVAQAKAEKWDALKKYDRERKKKRDAKKKEVVITLDPILEEFLELRGIKDEFVKACIYHEPESRRIYFFGSGFYFSKSKKGTDYWFEHYIAFLEFSEKKGELK